MSETHTVQLAGQTAIVTGGTVGIGRATCLLLAERGVNVVVVGRNEERLDEVCREIGARGTGAALRVRADVCRETDMNGMAAAAVERFGRIDMLVASAGILRASSNRLRTLAQMPTEEWDEVVDTNLKGVFLSNRAVLPAMTRQGGGHIVNISSTSGRRGYAFDTAYCASKYGVIGLTEALAEEARAHGVRVQAMLPGAIDTPMWDQNGPIRKPDFALAVERVAEVVLWMLTIDSDATVIEPVVEPFGKPKREGWMGG